MRTVKELKSELDKFDGDDLCYAYEGEIIGIVVSRGSKQGVIYCGEGKQEEQETEIIT